MTADASQVTFGWVEKFLHRLLDFDPDTRARLRALSGKVICLELRDSGGTPQRLYLTPTADGVNLARAHDGPVDVTISGTASVFARQVYARGGTPMVGELQINGDIDLGQRFQQALRGLDIDFEEMLARVLGDVPSHQLGNAARAARTWGRRAGEILARDVAEYLQEEAYVLAKRERVAAFLRGVDQLRADADRLERRIQRLQGDR